MRLAETVELPGLTLSPVEGDSGTAHFDLTLHIAETEQGLIGTALAYNTDLFDAATITRMLGAFQTLLERCGAILSGASRICRSLSEAERQQLLVEWNDTKTDDPKNLCIHQLFEAQVERTPDAIAVVLEDEQLTYARAEPPLQSDLRIICGLWEWDRRYRSESVWSPRWR